ncbi:MFS transporter [Candidatus Omnitrophota bacterium]
MIRFKKVLANRSFFLLWLSQIFSQFGDRIIQLSLVAMVYRIAPGSTFQLAKTLTFTIIPVFLIGPVAGVYVDRWDRKKTLFICDFLKAALVFSIPFVVFSKQALPLAYVIIFVIYCIIRFYVPAKLSLIPNLVEEEDLLVTNSLANITGMIAAALIGVAGIVIDAFGAKAGFNLACATFLVSAIMIIFIRAKASDQAQKETILDVGREVIEVIKKSVAAEVKEGVAYLANHKDMRPIMQVLFILGASFGVISVVSIGFVQDALGTVTKDVGFLVMFVGLGLFIGSLLYGRYGHKFSLIKEIFFSVGLSGLAIIAFAYILNTYPKPSFAYGLSFLFGICASPILVASYTLVHKVSSEDMRGKVFSNLDIVLHFAFVVCMLLSGKLADYIDRFYILVVTGCILVIIGVIGTMRGKDTLVAHD